MGRSRKKNLVISAMVLTVTALLLRGAGMLFRVYLSREIGAEGMGIHQLSSSVYLLFVNLSSAGIAMGVTRLVAEELAKGTAASVKRMVRRCCALALILGVTMMSIQFFGANLIARLWLRDERAALSLQVLAPSLPVIALSCCYKGYFTAQERVTGISASQIAEQLFRMAVTFWLLPKALPLGLAKACAAITLATTGSEIFSCLLLAAMYRRDKRRLQTMPNGARPWFGRVIPRLLAVSSPIAIRSCFRSALSSIENAMIPAGLKRSGSSGTDALAQYGRLKGMTLPILFFPSSLLASFSTLLVSKLARSRGEGCPATQERQTISRVIRLTLIFSIYIAGSFWLFAGELGQAIYREPQIGHMLRILAPLVPFMYLESMVDGMLTALDQQVSIMTYNMVDSLLRVALVFFLLPSFGMDGFFVVMYISNLFTSMLSARKLFSVTKLPVKWGSWVIAPLFSIGASGAALWLVLPRMLGALEGVAWLPSLPVLRCIAGLPLAGVFYLIFLFLTGSLTREDFRWAIAGFLPKRKHKPQ